MALLALAADHARAAGYAGVIAATVDHGLRPEAADEALRVARACAALGIEHETLRWIRDVSAPVGQERARLARHALLADWARRRGIAHVALGHTRDDRIETFLMRARQGSGWYGLAGPMPTAPSPAWPEGEGVTLVRPLLAFGREELRTELGEREIAWIDDPTNANTRFERVRMRTLAAAMTTEQRGRIVAIMDRLAILRTSVQAQAYGLLSELQPAANGEQAIALSVQDRAGVEAWRRFIEAMVMAAGQSAAPPRTDALARLVERIAAGDPALARGVTLGGALIRVRKGGMLAFVQAPPRRGEAAPGAPAWNRAAALLCPANLAILAI
jgi:tRNA(Ile)-lysidine synthase